MHKLGALGLLLDERVAGLLGKGLKVADRARVGRYDLQHLAALHAGERPFGFQDGQRAVQAAGIDLYINCVIVSHSGIT